MKVAHDTHYFLVYFRYFASMVKAIFFSPLHLTYPTIQKSSFLFYEKFR
jgi:hypothetical protein